MYRVTQCKLPKTSAVIRPFMISLNLKLQPPTDSPLTQNRTQERDGLKMAVRCSLGWSRGASRFDAPYPKPVNLQPLLRGVYARPNERRDALG